MIWDACVLYEETHTEEDELGNPIKVPFQVWEGSALPTPWSESEIAIEGRDVSKNEQRYMVPVAYAKVKDVTLAFLGGVMHKVTGVTDNGSRWTILQVKAVK